MDNAAAARRLVEILGLDTEPVAVFLLRRESPPPAASFIKITGQRYCQLLMRARHGESVVLVPDELACPAAAAAFGFRPLPEGLATGKGLVGFGIVEDSGTGRRMFEGMPRLVFSRVLWLPRGDRPRAERIRSLFSGLAARIVARSARVPREQGCRALKGESRLREFEKKGKPS